MKPFLLINVIISLLPSLAVAEDESYRVDRAEAFYSCSSEIDAFTILNSAFFLPYWEAHGKIESYQRSTCPSYSITNGTISAFTIMADAITPASLYDRWAIIKWSSTDGRTFYTPLMRSTSDELWYDGVSTVMELRALNGMLELFQ